MVPLHNSATDLSRFIATREKTGRLLAADTKQIWQHLPDGNLAIVEAQTGGALDMAFKKKNRGLINPDGSAIADSLFDFLVKNGFREGKFDLDIETVKGWIIATHEKTGQWINKSTKEIWRKLSDGSFVLVEGQTGTALNASFRTKQRGLINPDGTAIAKSLLDFMIKNGFKESLPDFDIETIKNWTIATQEKTGRLIDTTTKEIWQRSPDDNFVLVEGLTGVALHQAFKNKNRGLINPDGSAIAKSLLDFMIKNGFKEAKDDLDIETIKDWMIATQEKTGRWITKGTKEIWRHLPDGSLAIVKGQTGGALDMALKNKSRGLINSDGTGVAASLTDLRKQYGFTDAQAPVRLSQNIVQQSTVGSPKVEILTDPAEIARQTVTDLFSQFSNDLVAKLTDAVVAKLQPQQSVAVSQDQPTLPLQQPRAARRKRNWAKAAAEAEITGRQPELDATSVPDTAPVPIPVVPVSNDTSSQENGDVKLPVFNSPIFAKTDARGDSMISCLTNATRAFSYGDPIGLRGNLRKFVELFIHNTLLSFDEKHIRSLDVLEQHQIRLEKITRDYRYTCALIEIGKPQGKGEEPRLELVDLTRAFRDLISVLAVAKPDTFSPHIRRMVMDVVEAGGDIHIQIKNKGRLDDAQSLQYGHDIAKWFDAQFGVNQPAATPAIEEEAKDKRAKEKLQVRISASILKVFGVTAERFTEEVQSSRNQDYLPIAELIEQWVNDTPKEKETNNNLCIKLYTEAASAVNTLVQEGKNMNEIISALNAAGIGHDPRSGRTIEWNSHVFLRGAILASASLPLDIFASVRDTAADRALAVKKETGLDL